MLLRALTVPDWLNPEIVSIGPVALRWYGLAYIVGWFLAFLWAVRTVRRPELFAPTGPTRGPVKVPGKQSLEDYSFWIFLGILLGGRLGSMILYNPETYIADPLAAFRIWKGGMAFHGGFIGVCIAVVLFARRRKIEIFRMADLAAIGAPLGLFLGRIANWINQELWGHPTDVPWAFLFISDGTSNKIWDGNEVPRHPSQLYEAALEGLLLFAILWFLTRKYAILSRPGIASGVCIAGYGLARMFVEQFRVPDADLILGLSRGTAYSIPMVLVGGAIIVWAARRKPAEPVFETTEAEAAA